MRSTIGFLGLGLLLGCQGDASLQEVPLRSESTLEERQQLAASGQFVVPQVQGLGTLSNESMIAALDLPGSLNPVITELVSPHPDAVLDVPGLWRINPSKGASFLLLSTGQTNNAAIAAEPGSDFAPQGTGGDLARVRLELDVPPGADQLSFDYVFLSSESPEYVGSVYNDTFTATVSDGLGANRQITLASVNSSVFHEASDTRVGAGPFLLYTDDSNAVDLVFGPENFAPDQPLVTDAGTTDLQRVTAEIRGNGRMTLEFSIQDLGDGILDSAVLIDNVSFSGLQLVDPNTGDPQNSLVDDLGQVKTDPVELADQGKGRSIDRVAADGATRVLIRQTVPGPGQVTFALDAASAGDGGFAPTEVLPGAWLDQISVDTVEVGGQHYALALYKAPEDFVAVAAPDAISGQVAFSTIFTPTAGTAQPEREWTIEVVRPPVVVVHDLWSDCVTWGGLGGIMNSPPPGFQISCANYNATMSLGFDNDQNLAVLPNAVHEALENLRTAQHAAVTQVDVVGHGMGGLLARRYIDGARDPDRQSYRYWTNFNEGTVNRLMTIGSAHLGSRIADEAVRTREAMICAGQVGASRNWPYVNNSLVTSHAIRIDRASGHVALDEMTSTSPVLAGLGVSPVPSHAIVGLGGHTATRAQFSTMTSGSLSANLGVVSWLYRYMEWYHPLSLQNPNDPASALLAGSEQAKLIHSPPHSKIFCPLATRDANDFFATVEEQRGGLAGAFVTEIPIDNAEPRSAHFKANYNPAHRAAILSLLNSPIVAPDGEQSKFAPFMPAPAGLIAAKTNSCPINIPPPAACAPPAFAPSSEVAPFAHTLQITQPTNGGVVSPGASVTMTVDVGTAQPMLVVLGSDHETFELFEPPYSATLTIPADAYGTIRLSAVAIYADGDFAEAAPVNLQVQSSATLLSLSVLNGDAVILRPGKTRQLTVIGTYSNGARRNLTSGELGTRYAVSSASPIATVNADGLVTGLAPGNATVVVRNGNRITSINVSVGAGYCGDGAIDAGEQCDDGGRVDGDGCDRTCQLEDGPTAVCESPTVCNEPGMCSAQVTDLGNGSSDPSGLPLTITQTPPGPYAVGFHSVAVAVSNGTEQAQCTANLSVFDCERPSLACPSPFTAECTAAGGAEVSVPAATASDNCSAQVASPAGGVFPLGTSALAYSATDPSGNFATCTTSVTVRDTTAPMLMCPPPAVAQCTGNGQAEVDPGDATTFEGCTTATASDPGSASYLLGTTPVAYTASDEAGNQAQCTSSVTVVDTLPPALTCPAPVVAQCTSPAGAQVTPAVAAATDGCTTATVTGPAAGIYPLGTTPVTYLASDGSGNQATCSSSIQVVDTRAPTVRVTPPEPLWPVDSEYRLISLADCGVTVQDACGGTLTLEQAGAAITCVTSDEVEDKPNNGSDGDTLNDIVIVSPTQVMVRAERLEHGDGRVYEIKFTVRDPSGNVRNGVCPVAVPAPVCHPQPGIPSCGGRDNGNEYTVCRP